MTSLSLMGCSTPKSYGNQGLSVPIYSMIERQQVHDELLTCKAPRTIEFLKDYKVLRDQARVE